MLPADSEFQARPGLTAVFHGDPDEPPDTVRIEYLKRVVRKDTVIDV